MVDFAKYNGIKIQHVGRRPIEQIIREKEVAHLRMMSRPAIEKEKAAFPLRTCELAAPSGNAFDQFRKQVLEACGHRDGSFVLPTTAIEAAPPMPPKPNTVEYVIDGTKITQAGWKAPMNFDASLTKTVAWYLSNPSWLELL